jgi:short-subunit dehydrogenase
MPTALITGASDGIGLELARIHAAAGDDLILVARRLDRLHALRDEILGLNARKLNIHCYGLDLSLPESIEYLYNSTGNAGLQVDYLINNAGFGTHGPFETIRWEKEASMIDLNVRAVVHLSKLYTQDMIQRGSGRIMNVASTAAFQPGPGMAVYFATKAFVLHFSEAIHFELRRHGITVTSLCPGPTQSGFAQAMKEPGQPAPAMLKNKQIPGSAEVARFGYEAMMRGRAVAVHGFMNRFLSATTGLFPRSLVVRIAASITGGLPQ